MNKIQNRGIFSLTFINKIIDEGIDLITEYKNTVIFGDDETCRNSSYSNSYAEKEGVQLMNIAINSLK